MLADASFLAPTGRKQGRYAVGSPDVLDSRRFVGLADGSNSALVANSLTGNKDWAAAMQPGAALTRASATTSASKVMNALKIQMNPDNLGIVTATMRLAGGQLSVEDGDGNAAGIKDSLGGVAIGAYAPFRETTWRIGVIGGYSKGNFDQTNGSASGTSDNYDVGVYGGNQWGALALRIGALSERQSIATQRRVEFPGFSQHISAEYDAATAQIYGELGYRVDVGELAFEPFANAAYVYQRSDAFGGAGGSAALSGGAVNAGVAFTTMGLRYSTDFTLAGLAVTTRSSLGWRHAYGDTRTQSSFHFAGGDDFTTIGTALDEDNLVLDAGMDFAAASASTVGITYSGRYGSNSLRHTVKANLAVKL